MLDSKNIRIDSYQYSLPDTRIAKYPLEKRDISKLLVYNKGSISDDYFYNILDYISDRNTLVFNNTRVIRSRLLFRKPTGAIIEVFCLEPFHPADYQQALSATCSVEWRCMIGNLKKWKEKELSMVLSIENELVNITVIRTNIIDNEHIVKFEWDNSNITFSQILESSGRMPVPPYLNRDDEPLDRYRYQTIYSIEKGSVAAPTAGLHFSDKIISKIEQRGIVTKDVTLHVGAGTFIPVKSKTIEGHTMHSERFSVSRSCIESLFNKDTIAVGTTTVRTLESLYIIGKKLLEGYNPAENEISVEQWDPYSGEKITEAEYSLEALLKYMDNRGLEMLNATTSIIIVPGYKFRIVKGLITNFHMPASTLLLLVSALIGDNWKDVYNHALDNDYRFLSYGDSSILLP